jgi:hypothetical protein
MRSFAPAALLASLLACSPGDPAASATTGTSGASSSTGTAASTSTGTPTTGPTTGASGTGSPGTASSSTSSTSTTSGTSSTTDPATTDPASTTAIGTSTTGGTSSTGSTGDVPGSCPLADGDYGPCEAELGWAWNGSECTLRSGCDCAPDCDAFFPDAAACALACAGAGHCNEDRVKAAALAMDPIEEGDFCDGVYVCPMGDSALEQTLETLFCMLSCEPGNYPCDMGLVCAGLWQGPLGPEEWLKICAASLVPMSGSIWCVIFGP